MKPSTCMAELSWPYLSSDFERECGFVQIARHQIPGMKKRVERLSLEAGAGLHSSHIVCQRTAKLMLIAEVQHLNSMVVSHTDENLGQ